MTAAMFLGVGRRLPTLDIDAGPVRDMPNRKFSDQLALVEAIAVSIVVEIAQVVRW